MDHRAAWGREGNRVDRLSELCFLKENHEAFQTRSRELLRSAANAVSGAALEAFLLREIIRLWQKYLLARYLLALFALYPAGAERKDENLKTCAWE